MKNSTYSDLCRTFRKLATWTWNKLDTAHHLGISFNEETITESLLLKLAERHAGRGLTIRAYTKPEEGKGTRATNGKPTGADWSFWVVDNQGEGIEVRIQAKRLFPSGTYSSLNGTDEQIIHLRQNCGKAIPIYLLYNAPFATWHHWHRHIERYCMESDCGWPEFPNGSDWGCAFAHVTAIPYKNKPHPRDIKFMQPWHCLVCPCDRNGTSNASLPQRISSALKNTYNQIDDKADTRFQDFPDLNFEPHKVAPAWAKLLRPDQDKKPAQNRENIAYYAGTPTFDQEQELDKLLAEHDLKGVVLIEETESEKPR